MAVLSEGLAEMCLHTINYDLYTITVRPLLLFNYAQNFLCVDKPLN